MKIKFKTASAIFVGAVLAFIGCWIAIIWIACHFVAKFW